MIRKLGLVLVGLICLINIGYLEGLAANPGKKKSKDEWLPQDKMAEAIERAQEEGRPIIFLHRFRYSDSTYHDNRCLFWGQSRELKEFVKVVIYDEDKEPIGFRKVRKQQEQKEGDPEEEGRRIVYLPRLYITDANLKLVICVLYEMQVPDFIRLVKEALKELSPIYNNKTLKSMAKKIEKAEKNIEKKRYKLAITELLKLDKKKNQARIFKKVAELLTSITQIGQEELFKTIELIETGEKDKAKESLKTIEKEFKKLKDIADAAKKLKQALATDNLETQKILVNEILMELKSFTSLQRLWSKLGPDKPLSPDQIDRTKQEITQLLDKIEGQENLTKRVRQGLQGIIFTRLDVIKIKAGFSKEPSGKTPPYVEGINLSVAEQLEEQYQLLSKIDPETTKDITKIKKKLREGYPRLGKISKYHRLKPKEKAEVVNLVMRLCGIDKKFLDSSSSEK